MANVARTTVRMPDLFKAFLRTEPATNPLYEATRKVSEEAVCRLCQVDAKVARAIIKCDFSYFAAVMAPHAHQEPFRTICDWGNWIFPFDDLFDIGALRADHEAASRTIGQLLDGFMDVENVSSHPRPAIVSFHDNIWQRIRTSAPAGIQDRYVKAMTDYCDGALAQVQQVEIRQAPAVETMLSLRRSSVCVATLFVLVEFGHSLNIPSEVFESPAIQDVQIAGIDLTLMHNDILSYHREEMESVPHNLVAVARMQGMSPQAAFDYIARLIDSRHVALANAILDLPSWGPEIDGQVVQYVQAVKDVVKANLYWSFKSGRFLNETQKMQVKSEGLLSVLSKPAFLELV